MPRTPRTPLHLLALPLLATLAVTAASSATGRIVVLADEWLIADLSFETAPAETTALALNAASFLTGGFGNVLVYSTNFGLSGASLASTMTGAGYGWTIAPVQPFTLALLQQYDAVYFAGTLGSGAANAAVLQQYVNSGGGVLICSGTGTLGRGVGEAAAWNPLLNAYGLNLSGEWFPIGELITVPVGPSANPVVQGVSTVSWGFGQKVNELVPGNPDTDAILGSFAEFSLPSSGVIATYGVSCPASCAADLNGDGTVDGADLGALLGAWSAAGSPADLNCDDVVDGGDLGALLAAWGAC